MHIIIVRCVTGNLKVENLDTVGSVTLFQIVDALLAGGELQLEISVFFFELSGLRFYLG